MKILNLFLLLLFTSAISYGQTISINGTVNNQQGQPVPFAFIRDAQHNYATYSDSTGNFQLKADPTSALIATAEDFKDAFVKIENKNSIAIVMNGGTTGNGGNTSDAFKRKVFDNTIVNTGMARVGYQQEDTQGSRFLFEDWIRGYAVSAEDSLIQNPTYFFNYDKIDGDLLYSLDRRSMNMVNSEKVKYFVLYDHQAHPHIFEYAPAISKKPFVEAITSGKKYKIYKKYDTKLVKANYSTNGISSSGNRFDEYVDNITYYVVKAGGQPQPFNLKKKSIKEKFAGDADKFIAAQSSRDIDDDYLRELGESLNQ